MKAIGRASSGDFAFPSTNLNHSDIPCFVDGNFIDAGLIDGKSQVWRIDLESFILVQSAYARQERAFGKLDLCRVIGKIQERKTGIGTEANIG